MLTRNRSHWLWLLVLAVAPVLLGPILLTPILLNAAQEAGSTARSGEAIVNDLRSDDVAARRDAAIEVWHGGREVQRLALPVLIELLGKEKDGQVRLAVLDAVTELGPEAEPAVESLVKSFRSNFGGNQNERRHQEYRTALALAAIGKPSVEGLRGLLGERRESIRAEAIMALGRIGPDAAAAVPDLIKSLGDELERIQREAALALGLIGPAAVEPLIEAAAGESAVVRAGAVLALGRSPMPTERVGEVVLASAADTDSLVRAAAMTSLAALQFPPEVLLAQFRDNLRHENEVVRMAIVNALSERPSLLAQFQPELRPLLTAEHEGVARHAAFLLQKIGPPAAPVLIDALRDEKSRVEQIAEALAQIGGPIHGLLLEAAADPQPRVRQGAALALGRILPVASRTVDQLTAGLADPSPDVQAAFLDSIGRLGRRASDSVPAVRAKLKDESPDTRMKAVTVLLQAAPRDSQVLDDFLSMLEDGGIL